MSMLYESAISFLCSSSEFGLADESLLRKSSLGARFSVLKYLARYELELADELLGGAVEGEGAEEEGDGRAAAEGDAMEDGIA